MAHVPTSALLFITLLQLCRTEFSGTWYSANVINNGADFSPKPLSEIFSTQSPPFSSTNPIVVLPSSTTAAPPAISTSFLPTLSTFSSIATTGRTSPVYTQTPSTFSTTQSTYEPSSTLPPFSPTFLERRPPVIELQPIPIPVQDKNQMNGPPNYFLIYQQAPQTVQQPYPSRFTDFPSSTSSDISSPQTQSTFPPEFSSPTFSTFQPEVSTPQTTLSTFRPDTSSSRTTLFQPSVTTPSTTLSTTGPVMSTPSTFGSFTPGSSSLPSTLSNGVTTSVPTTLITASSKTNRPCPTKAPIPPVPRYPALKIRMVAPSGSITNIHVNPSQPTTKAPVTKRTTTVKTTTTRKPKTKRPGRNTYEGCTRKCEVKKPICAVPLAQSPIDPDKLKGFPSICHMACHNSFRKDHYEMLVDGRCGKLRTRIQTVDKQKVNRVELNKAQYTIFQEKPETVLEFSSLPRK